MRKLFGLLLVVALVLSFSVVATTPVAALSPPEVWVCVTGEDTNPWTEAEPFATIQKGIEEVADEGTVNVKAGTYTEDLEIDGKNLTLIGAGSGEDPDTNTVVHGDTDFFAALEVKNASSLAVSGFRFIGREGSGMWGATMYGIYAYHQPIVVDIRDNALVFFTQSGIQIGRGEDGSVIQNNQFIRETRGEVTRGGAGPAVWNSEGVLLKGNTMTSVLGIGIYIQGSLDITLEENVISAPDKDSPSDAGIWVQASEGVTIRGNTVSDFTHGEASGYTYGKAGAGIYVWALCDDVLIEGNDLEDNSVGVYAATRHDLTSPTDVRVNDGNLVGNEHYGVLNLKFPATTPYNKWDYHLFGAADSVVDATNNWWGHDSGPGGVGPGSGDAVTDNVDFAPWYFDEDKDIPIVSYDEVETETETGTAKFGASAGDIEGLEAIEPPVDPPKGVELPHGMFQFRIENVTPAGATVALTIELPQPVPVGTVWWKHDGTRWYSLRNLRDDGDNIMVIELTDGGLGDTPGSPAGTILDPGGPGNPVPSLTVGWEGSSVNKAAVVAPWIALFAAMMAGATLVALRRRGARI